MTGSKSLRISLAMLLLLASVVQGAQVIRYVDPDAAGAGDGTSWTDAYTSLQAWEAGEQTDLVLAGDYHTVNCRSSGGTADTTACTIVGWTTGVANYIEIIGTDFPTDGIYDATKYRLQTGNTHIAIYCQEDYVRISYLQFDVINTSSYSRGFQTILNGIGASNDIRVHNCIFKGTCSGTGEAQGIYSADGNVLVWNCTIYGFVSGGDSGFAGILQYIADSFSIYNTTIYNCHTGIRRVLSAAPIVTNCAVGNCSDDFGGGVTADYCISDDGDGTNAQNPLSLDWDNEFTDANNGDFSLVAGGNCIGNGTDDPGSGLYSDDIIGTARSSVWDIGAFEYTVPPAGGGSAPIIIIMD